MSTPRELSRIANRIAGKMTDDGWVSPGRKNLVSDKNVMELIDLIFNEIWRELDDGKRVHIRKQMIFKKILSGICRSALQLQRKPMYPMIRLCWTPAWDLAKRMK